MLEEMSRALVTLLVLLAAAGCGRYGFGEDVDAGSGADASPDGDPDAPRSPLTCADITGALVCSGFEGGSGEDWQTESENNGTSSMLCTNPRSGQGCYTARVGAGGAAARAVHPFTPTGSGMIYARVHAFIEAGVPLDGINVVALDAADSGIYGPDLNVINEDRFQVHLDGSGTFGGASVGPVPRGVWFCLHAAVLIDESDGSVRAGYDDTAIEQGGLDTYPNGPYDMIAVGLDWTSDQQGPIEVLIDDVVVATSPVPCGS